MSLIYAASPIAAYLVAGTTKFLVNCTRERRIAFDLVGLGGLPSTHTTITTTIATLIGLREGVDTPVFGLALSFALIVAIDAMDLRRKVGLHAQELNRLLHGVPEARQLRTRVGHSPVEIIAGIVMGVGCATLLNCLGAVGSPL